MAAVDCGTNSTRLLIAGPDGATRDRRMVITRLGEGVDRTGELQAGAIERTLSVLGDFRQAMTEAGVRAMRAVATSALRDASNAAAFLEPASALLGAPPSVLAGIEEGRLSYRGATSELPAAGGPYLVVDVGGGSTELVTLGEGGGIEAVSLDVGCVRLTERFLAGDPPTAAQLSDATGHVLALLGPVREQHPAFGTARVLVGLAGTVSALVRLWLELEEYDRAAVHHALLTREAVSGLLDGLVSLTVAGRRARVGMEHDRADVIVGGTVVLLGVMDTFGFTELTVSESDILDGIAAELLEQ